MTSQSKCLPSVYPFQKICCLAWAIFFVFWPFRGTVMHQVQVVFCVSDWIPKFLIQFVLIWLLLTRSKVYLWWSLWKSMAFDSTRSNVSRLRRKYTARSVAKMASSRMLMTRLNSSCKIKIYNQTFGSICDITLHSKLACCWKFTL